MQPSFSMLTAVHITARLNLNVVALSQNTGSILHADIMLTAAA